MRAGESPMHLPNILVTFSERFLHFIYESFDVCNLVQIETVSCNLVCHFVSGDSNVTLAIQ